MTLAKLSILGQEMELLWCDMNYHREIRRNGKPATEIMGGLITICFETTGKTDMVLRWMTKESEDNTWNEVDKMEKGKVCFYENGFEYPPTKNYEFNDAHLILFKETFNSIGEEPMQTILTISPAIQNYGADFVKLWNESWVPPSESMPYQPAENTDEFYLNIKHLTDKETFSPLEIPGYEKTSNNEIPTYTKISENGTIKFEIEVFENSIDSFDIEILKDDIIIYSIKSGEKKLPNNYEIGKHIFEWDGFDNNDVYNSSILTSGELKAQIKGKRNGKEKTAESSSFSFKYKEVKWVDVKIDKINKRIDITLRINLADKKNKSAYKTFNQLLALSISGLKEYWGRNSTRNLNGKSITISGVRYEVYINPTNTKNKSMPKLNLVALKDKGYTPGGKLKGGRSRNWIGSRILYYNDDFSYNFYQAVNHLYSFQKISRTTGTTYDEIDFKHTAAHEIGHEILQTFGGKINFSYDHKATSTLISQSAKPFSRLPANGEVDLMKYFHHEFLADKFGYYDLNLSTAVASNLYYERSVASENDLLGLIWCAKLKQK